jgi:cytoskeletal protein CcmA (bactofilin family)
MNTFATPARPASPSFENPTTAPAARTASVLGPTLRFKGELVADEDLLIQGQVEGSIEHSQNLTIGTEGGVKGNIRARTVIIDGTVEGDVYGVESVSVRETARVRGNIFAPRVGLADGAKFTGRIDMDSAPAAVSTTHGSRAGEKHIAAPSSHVISDAAAERVITARP